MSVPGQLGVKPKNRGGRPKGAKAGRHARSLRAKYPILPLEYMLKVVNDKSVPNSRRDEMAKAAAPYCHAKLAAIDITGSVNHDHRHTIDVTKLSPDELNALEQLLLKAQMQVINPEEQDALHEANPNLLAITYDPSDDED